MPLRLPEFLEPLSHDIGRPYDVLGCIPIVHLLCRCQTRTPLLLAGMGGTTACPHCGRGFRLVAITCQGEQMGVKIDSSAPADKVRVQ
jgi:hypothetical protein